jgi:hypothetical protein
MPPQAGKYSPERLDDILQENTHTSKAPGKAGAFYFFSI